MRECPLKEAAKDAPNYPAILGKDLDLTFSQLDKIVDENPSSFLIAQIFGAWRNHRSIFPTNPASPTKAPHIEGPPQSLLLHTSGSTSAPKIAVLTLANLIANAKSVIEAVDLKPKDQWKLTLPLYHVGGISILIRCILARATLVIDDSPLITHLSYVPTHLYRATPVYKKLKCLLLGGAPIQNYPSQLPIYTSYGLTEMASTVTLNGNLLPNRELKLIDGEIFVKGPCLFQGYFGEKPHADWFGTKDLGRWANGKLEILGRKDWMFISGGENIQPEEIEAHLLTIPDVEEAAVLPVNDPEFGQRPVAVISSKRKLTLQEMQNHLSERLPKFKIPISLFFLNEMPRKNHFKLDRFILAQYIKDQLDRNASGQKKSAYL